MRVYRGLNKIKDVLVQSKNAFLESKILNKSKKDIDGTTNTWMQRNKGKFIKGMAASLGGAALIAGIVWSGNYYVNINTVEVYHVYVDEEQVGTVSNPEVVEEYILARIDKLEEKYPNAHMELNADAISYKNEKAFKAESDNTLALHKLDTLLAAHAIGVEIRVDGTLVGVVKDRDTADAMLQQYQEKYLPKTAKPKKTSNVSILSSVETEAANLLVGESLLEEVVFVEGIEFTSIETKPEQINDTQDLLKKLEIGDTKPTKYVVQPGDCINCIARDFEISPQQIFENNPTVNENSLQIGTVLDLTVLQPALTVKTVEKIEQLQEVHYETVYEKDNTLKLGINKTVKEGVEGKKIATYLVTKVNGMLTEEELIKEDIILEPVSAIVRKGTKVIKGEGTGKFSWPVLSPSVSSSFGQRWGRLHAGIDITSGKRNILASDNGTVKYAGYNSGYGYHVIIDHKNGFHTLYAHLSKMNTSKGKIVEKGEVIGVMGSTGNSTGIHLHFEVRKYGSQMNPSKYLNK